MITSISLRNFKLHRNTRLEFGKINVFFGLNNTGKSSIIHTLQLLHEIELLKMLNKTNTEEIKRLISDGEEYAEIEAECILNENEEIKVNFCIDKNEVKINEIKTKNLEEEEALRKIGNSIFFSRINPSYQEALKFHQDGILKLLGKLKSPEIICKEGYGRGTQQIVSIFLLIIFAKPYETICLEEPENNLHPKIQYRLAKLLAEIASEQKKQFILTTYSENIIFGFLNSVAKGKIKKDDVFMYHFKRKGNSIKIKRKKINENGQMEGGLEEIGDAMVEELRDFFNPSSQQKQNGISKKNRRIK